MYFKFLTLLSLPFLTQAVFAEETTAQTEAFVRQAAVVHKPTKLAHAVPRLIVLLVVDQMRSDQLSRFQKAMQKTAEGKRRGLLELRDRGVDFQEATVASAPSVTAAGHASLCTGSAPRTHGIVGNSLFDRDLGREVSAALDESTPLVYSQGVLMQDALVRAPSAGASPQRMLSKSFDQLLREVSDGKSRGLSVSIKDRGAIFCAGKQSAAYWYDSKSGSMVTSTFYVSQMPDWVNSFNASQRSRKAEPWASLLTVEQMKELLPSKKLKEAFDVRAEGSQWFGSGFPYSLKKNGEAAVVSHHKFQYSPQASDLLVDFALEGIKNLRLGCRDRIPQSKCDSPLLPDVLTISFSTTDLVGHAFGPDSPELMDIFLNLNKSVSRLMKELDSKFKRDEVLYIVSADHGVQSAPEVLARAGRTGGRFNPSESVKSLEAQLVKIWGQGPWINAIVTGEIHFNEAVFNRNKKKFSEAVELLNKAPKIMGIHKFILLDPKLTEGQKTLSLYHKGLYPERSGQVLIQFNEGWTLDPWNVASHGTAHPDDVRIPLIFSGWRVRSGVRLKTAASADDAVPTVLSGLGLKLPKNVTGQSHAQDVFIP